MSKRIAAVLCILAIVFALSANADATWECPACHRRVQTILGDICPYCGAQRHIHTWREASCTEPKTCTECGATEGEALGHQWDEGRVIKTATCQETGETFRTCKTCGFIEDETIPRDPDNHVGGIEVKGKQDATCTTDGYTGDTYCKACGEVISSGSVIKATGHQWDEGRIIKEVTCYEDGEMLHACIACGSAQIEKIPKDSSKHVGGTEVRGQVDATCTSVGYTGDAYCKGCGGLISKGNAIPALGHSWQEATYTAPKTCKRCGVTEGEPLELSVEIGDTVTFGHYPQTESGKDNTPIEWLVLDVQGSRALLLSKYGLDAKPYNTKDVNITWEQCSLRKWLNNEFLNAAFSATEQKAILLTAVDNSKSQGYSEWDISGGNNTQDKVFLLSYAEANRYLGVTGEDSNNKQSRVKPTDYAKNAGAWTKDAYKTADGDDAGFWWLRSPGSDQCRAARVRYDGSLGWRSVFIDYGCTRPALWVDLESDEYEFATTDSVGATVETTDSEDYQHNQSATVGDILTFGRYPQTASGTDSTPIEWIVLDVEGSKALLLSKYGLDEKPYNTEEIEITWEQCSMRKWLNGEFLNQAFSSEERSKIIRVKISNPDNPSFDTEGGSDTDDQVFLLSIDEAKKYFATGDARKTKSTAYAKINGVWTNDSGYCFWWLRSPGYDQSLAAYVDSDGGVYVFGYSVSNDYYAVRPAFWLNLES